VAVNHCEHGFPQFLCLRCGGNDRSGPEELSNLTGEVNPDNGEQIKIADQVIFDTIAAAEEVHDPLDGLIEKTAGDPGAPFTPEVVAALAALRKDNRSAFEALRARLKSAGCRMAALDEAIAEQSGDVGARGLTPANILVDLAQTAELYHARTARASPTSTLTATGRHGPSAPRASDGGWRTASMRRRRARRVRRHCNQR
jgi:hypothetical protein